MCRPQQGCESESGSRLAGCRSPWWLRHGKQLPVQEALFCECQGSAEAGTIPQAGRN